MFDKNTFELGEKSPSAFEAQKAKDLTNKGSDEDRSKHFTTVLLQLKTIKNLDNARINEPHKSKYLISKFHEVQFYSYCHQQPRAES